MSLVIRSTLVLSGAVANAQMQPILFMDPLTDAKASWGLLTGEPNALSRAPGLTPPPVNYTAGATVFASFTTTDPSPASFEVFVAIGRPGEPVMSSTHGACSCSCTFFCGIVQMSIVVHPVLASCASGVRGVSACRPQLLT